MAALQGYRTQQKIGQSQFQTYQQVGRAGSGSYAADTVSKVLWDTTPLNVPVEAGSTKLVINATAHTALPGDMLRFASTSANPGIEVGVVKVTANTIEIGGELPALPLLADEFKIMRWITPTADQNGNLVFTPGPTTFNRNGVITTAAEDTANPANNRGLPVNVIYYRNGVPVSVNIDTVTPANNRPLPVEIANVSGSVTINAGDLNVSTVATNDSMAIGDNITGNRARVAFNDDAATYALKVKDDDANTKLGNIILDTLALSATTGNAGSPIANDGISIHGSDGSLNRKLLTDINGRLQVDVLSAALPSGASTLAEQQTQTTRLTSIRDAVELLDNVVGTDGAAKPASVAVIGGVTGAGIVEEIRTDGDGHLQVDVLTNVLPTGAATETTLASIDGKLANNYGAATAALRTAAQLGNTTGAADFGAGSDSAQTLRVSANLKRSGNELSYNTGAADANTLRSVLSTRHEAAATPIAARLSNGSGFITDGTVPGNTQYTVTAPVDALKVASFTLGFDAGANEHRELLVDSQGRLVLPAIAIQNQTISYAEELTIGAGAAVTVAIPASCKNIKIQADDTNNATLRVKINGTATASSGMQFQPGRSEDYVGGALTLSVIAEAGGSACKMYFQFSA
jgi:hypothetical protein